MTDEPLHLPKIPSVTLIESDDPDVELPDPTAMEAGRSQRRQKLQSIEEALSAHRVTDPNFEELVADFVGTWNADREEEGDDPAASPEAPETTHA